MRRLRYLRQDHPVEVTSRTLQSRLLLRPGVAFNEVFNGILGRAQRLFRMELHYAAVLSNHYHLLLSPSSPRQLAAFCCYLNGNLAKEIGRVYGWKEKIWAGRYHHVVISQEEAAQVSRLRYLLSQGVKEDLVTRLADWPGPNFVDALLRGSPVSGTWFDRTAEYEARRRSNGRVDPREFANQETVLLSPLPCWRQVPPSVWRAIVQEMIHDVQAEAAAERTAQGRSVLGREGVLRQHPHATPGRSKRSPAPGFHAATGDARRALAAAYSDFLGAFRDAAARLKAGDLAVRFPEGSFPPPLPLAPT